MSDPYADMTTDELRDYALFGKEPARAAAAISPPTLTTPSPVNSPAGQGWAMMQARNAEVDQKFPTGSFTEGFTKGAASAPFGVARLLGVEGAGDVAKLHGEEMGRVRSTPFGAAGATAANVLTGMAAMPATGYLGNMVAGGALEGLQDLGEGKTGVEGFGRGVVGGFLGNWLANTIGTTGNAAWKAAGGKGRWSDDATEYIYDFAKSKGVHLRPGDVAPDSAHVGFENLHAGSVGNAGVENQASQLYTALFGDGTKNEITAGFRRVDDVMTQARNSLWGTLDNIPDKTTVTPTGLLTAVEDVFSKYPKLVRAIDNAEVKQKLVSLMKDKQAFIDQGYSAASAHRMAAAQNEMTFSEVRNILTNLNPEIAKVKGQAAKHDIVKDAYVELSRMKDAINGDLKRWGTQNPQKYGEYQKVLDAYKRDFLPYETNPYIVNWKAGAYDEKGHEKMVADLLDPTKKSQRENLIRDYVSKIDHDATGYLEMLRVADRAGKVLSRGSSDASGGIPSMLSPFYTGARIAAHKGSGKTWMTPLTGASTRIFSTQSGPLSNALEGGVRGGLALSGQEIFGRRER